MNRIAFIIGDKFLYWNAIVLTLAILTAITMYWALAVRKPEDRRAAAVAIPVAFLFSLILSRLVHWYCRPQGYENMFRALVDYSRGSFALIGAFAGCLLTALLLRLFRVSRSLPRMLDEMAVAGSLGICVGRLAALFTTADRGIPLPQWVPFPFAARLLNTVSGETEVRLAVFMFQSFIAGILFISLLIFFLRGEKKNLREGDTSLLFLLWYCGTQAVLDSPRYDSLYFRSNGFVSIVQIFGILTVLFILILFTVRMLKAGRWKKIWMTFLAIPLLGGAGYMEYHVQRHGSQALFAYSVMSVCMLLAMILIQAIRRQGLNRAVRKVQAGYPDYQNRPVYRDPACFYGNQPRDLSGNPAQGYPAGEKRAPQKRNTSGKSGRYQGKFAAKK